MQTILDFTQEIVDKFVDMRTNSPSHLHPTQSGLSSITKTKIGQLLTTLHS